MIAIIIPRKYRPVIIRPPRPGKKAFTKNAYIGTLAEQLMKGVKSMVIFLSRSLGKVLVDITAGTVQPKPMSMGTMLLPDRPIFLKSLSIKNATLAIYPLSSSMDRKKNRVTMTGRKLKTLPTPSKIPSITRPRNVLLIFRLSNAVSVRFSSPPIRSSKTVCKKAPITLKVKKNTTAMIRTNIGIAVNLPESILSIFWLLACSLLSFGFVTASSHTFLM